MGGDKIDRIVATGQVKFVQEDRVATGQEATYYKDRDEVVLVGNPQLWQNENNLKGERIIFNLKDNKMRVESSPQSEWRLTFTPPTRGPEARKAPLPGQTPEEPQAVKMHHLSIQSLNKSYNGRKVVDQVCLEVNSGEVVGLLGPNGAGKTSTFFMILGLLQPDAGKIVLDGQDISTLPIYRRARLGLRQYLPRSLRCSAS